MHSGPALRDERSVGWPAGLAGGSVSLGAGASLPAAPAAQALAPHAAAGEPSGWEHALEAEAQKLLATGQPEVWDVLTRRFESRLIRTALSTTHGRRMEAAQRLGIGRNTITRKIQELGLGPSDDPAG
ncbi:helix-turn-helix domain-containing protein [Paracidovorax cattleyae]